MKKKQGQMYWLKLLYGIFFFVALGFPLAMLLSSLTLANISSLLASEKGVAAIKNSLATASVSTVISVLLAFLLSLCLHRSGIPHKRGFIAVLTVPMLIPSISHGMGLVLLLGSNGIMQPLFPSPMRIYGFWGIVLGSLFYSFPVALLMFLDVLNYEDFTTYEMADVLGIPKYRQFFSITFPYLKKPLISIFFATFTLVVTDYGIPLTVGGKIITLPVMMYQEVVGLLDFNKGSVIGSLLLVPAVVAFLFDLLAQDKETSAFTPQPWRIRHSRAGDAVAYVFCASVSVIVLLPQAAFLLLAFVKKYPEDLGFTLSNVLRFFDLGRGEYLINSIMIAFGAAVFGTALSYFASYITTRMQGAASKLLHLVAITTLAVPGLVLGLSYVLCFRNSPIYGGFVILILVNIIHFFASPYLLARNSFGKLNKHLEDVGLTIGASRFQIIRSVMLPQMKSTVIEMFVYYFVNSMITISAVSFLSNINTMPASLLITQFEAQLQLEFAAFISLMLLISNLAVKSASNFLRRQKHSASGA